MKLEVGMYVRTDKGYISKVKELTRNYTKGKRLVNSYSYEEVEENYLRLDGNQCEFIESIDYSIPPCYPTDKELEKIENHIIKASHNIIDLIEEGDYVNGRLVYQVGYNFQDDYVVKIKEYDGYETYIHAKDIKTIITKQQFESMQYRVEE